MYKVIFEVDTETGLMFVPEGEGIKLDYETDKSFNIEVTVRDRCENGCYFGKWAEKCSKNVFFLFGATAPRGSWPPHS
jgi:hypothetical protein